MRAADFNIASHHDELRRPVVVMAAKRHDVDLSHSGGKIAKDLGEGKEVRLGRSMRLWRNCGI